MMRKICKHATKSLSIALVGIMLAFSVLGTVADASQVEVPALVKNENAEQLYVSLEGDDAAEGTLENPLRTLEAARDKVRAMKANGSLPAGGVVVNIRGGEYPHLGDSFALDAQDSGTAGSPIIWRAYKGEDVKITGSIIVNGSKFVKVEDTAILNRLTDEVQDQILMYDLGKENGLTSFAPIPKIGFLWPAQAGAMSILVDGEVQSLSRYPNDGFISISSIQSSGFIPRNHRPNPDGSCPECSKASAKIPCKIGSYSEWLQQAGGIFTVNDANVKGKFPLWSQETDIWTRGYFNWDWADDSCAVKSLEDTSSGIKMTMKQPSMYGIAGSGRKFYAFNLLCEIDNPGEWYLDRENAKLYLYPKKDIADSNVELAMQTNPLVTMDRVEYVEWQGVTFSKSNSHGIVMKDCENVEIAGCNFSDLGQRAIYMGDPDRTDINTGSHGGRNNTVRSCDITRMGQGGIFLGGGNRYTLTPGKNKVVNCDISDFATVKRTYSPAVDMNGCGNIVERNHIYDSPHTAIMFSGNDMKIYGNDIHNVCYETADVGAIYSGRSWSYQGIEIKNNFIHDIVNTGGLGSAAVYVDDLGSGVTMTENFMVNIPGYATLFGGGRDNVITNNIQLNYGNGKGFHYDDRGLGWSWFQAAGPDGECYAELANLRANENYDKALWDEKYPGLAEINLTDKQDRVYNSQPAEYYYIAARPANSNIEKNILVGVANPFGNISGNTKKYSHFDTVTNVAYPKGTEIGFTNADIYDYTVQEGSMIKEMMGDNHFKVEEMGLYEDEFRTLKKNEIEKAKLLAPEDSAEELVVTNGVRFIWNKVDKAGSYTLEIATDKEFIDIVKSCPTDATTISVLGLDKEATYFWRVIARERAVNGSYSVSDVRTFTTSEKDDSGFFEGFRNFDEWKPVIESGVKKGSPTNTTNQAHSGRYGYELNESMDTIEKVFGTKHNDMASVWLYDNMNKNNGAAAVARVTWKAEDGSEPMVGAGVFVATNGAHKNKYVVRDGANWYETTVERTEGWHELKFDYTEAGKCVIYVDNVLVYTVKDVPYYDRIAIGDFWNHAGYPGDVGNMIFDDVRIGEPEVAENVLYISLPEESIVINMDETYQLEPIVETDLDVDAEIAYSAAEWEIAQVNENGLIQPVRKGKTVVTVESVKNPMIRTTINVEVTNIIDKTELKELYNTLMKLVKSDYTYESWNVLAQGLIQGYEEIHSEDSTLDSRNVAVKALKDAQAGLIDIRENIAGDNSGFELGNLNGFGNYPSNGDQRLQIEVNTEEPHSGEYSAKLVTEQIKSNYVITGLTYTIPGSQIEVGDEYEVSYWVKSGDGKARDMGIHVTLRGNSNVDELVYSRVENGWTKVTHRLPVIAPGTTSLELILGNKNDAESAGVYYIDDVALSKVSDRVPVESVTFDKHEITVSSGDTVELNATVAPENATNDIIIWTTSDSNIATVVNGVVTAVAPGVATITVMALDGEIIDTCTIIVTVPVEGVELSNSNITLELGESFTLQATVKPEDAFNKEVTWSSSDDNVATVDENGNVTAVAKGEAIITVTTVEGEYTATCVARVVRTIHKTELEEFLAKCRSYQIKDYVAKNWKAFEKAMEDAEVVLADENATKEMVDAALDALKEAEGNLRKPGEKPEKPVKPEKPEKPGKPEETEVPEETVKPERII